MSILQQLQPLPYGTPIVDPKTGNATLEFQQWWQQLFSNADTTQGEVDGKVPLSRLINTTSPIAGGGSLENDLTLTHADSGVTADTYGDATHVPQIAVDAKGHITGVTDVEISGGSGSITLITETVTTSSQATVTFSSLPTTYRDLEIRIRGRSTNASTDIGIQVRFNGDTSLIYDYAQLFAQSGTSTVQTANQSSMRTIQIPGSTAPANAAGIGVLTIGDYRGTTFNKNVIGKGGEQGGGQISRSITTHGVWRSTAAITQIDIFCTTGNFVDNSVVSLYGVM